MSIEEQKEIKEKYYREAMRYMANAKETLKKAGKADDFYKDDKYVKTACGTAYNGLLKALDGYFILKEIGLPRGKKSIQYYQSNITILDKKLLNYVNNAYEILHVSGYYEGVTDVKVVLRGFELAYSIINKIKP